jgi:hypothetical protein
MLALLFALLVTPQPTLSCDPDSAWIADSDFHADETIGAFSHCSIVLPWEQQSDAMEVCR